MERSPTPPTGTVTFLLTDIEGSTRFWQQNPEAMKAALVHHHALLQHSIESHGGYVFQVVGDAFCAAFATAPEASMAALAAQRALRGAAWPETCVIRVRMAVHTGNADVHIGDHKSGEYASGLTLSRAARLLGAGHGDQILLSSVTQVLVDGRLPPGVELRDLGERRLRDLVRPEHVFQVVAPDLPSEFPPLRSLDTHPHNLPVHLTSFIGREREMSELGRLLSETRLLTVTGAGGIGKTRLSLHVAAEALESFPDGLWLVELASLADPTLVPQAVAAALGVREEAGRPLLATLTEYLRDRHLLLILDNCEHLVAACATLADALLRMCHRLRLLTTSREVLGTAGEAVFRLSPLSIVGTRETGMGGSPAPAEAQQLFVARAVAIRPDFRVTSANGPVLARICERLEGIPLAIELAAARVRALSLEEIEAHLIDRFRLLTGGSRTALPRQQTLRALVDWSYDLLPESERALLRRLSVCAGGWTLEAAEAIGAGAEAKDEVMDLLVRLVDKSLIAVDEHGGISRYRFLETIRQYGVEKLGEKQEAVEARDRHGDFYLRVAEAAAQHLERAEQAVWLKHLEADHDNLRAAMRWWIERGDVERGLRFVGALWPFWDARGHVDEGRQWFDQILERLDALPPSNAATVSKLARARALDGAARMLLRKSQFDRVNTLYRQSLALWREIGDRRGTAEALNNLGDLVRVDLNDRVSGRAFIAESLALFRELGDRRGIAHALNNLADVIVADGGLAQARGLYEESVPLFREIADERGMAHALSNLGGVLTMLGEYDGAEVQYRESERLAAGLDDKHERATVLRGLAGVARHRGDHALAASLFEESVARFHEMGDRHCWAIAMLGRGWVFHDSGDQERARSLGEQALETFRELENKVEMAESLSLLGRAALARGGVDEAARRFAESLSVQAALNHVPGILVSLDDLARVAVARGQTVRMARLLGAADAERTRSRVTLSTLNLDAHERVVAAARAQLDEDTFAAAWAEGSEMTLPRAMAVAQEAATC